MSLKKIGGAYVLRAISDGSYLIGDDLTIQKITLPEAIRDTELEFSAALDKYIAVSWLKDSPTYLSDDLMEFEIISGDAADLRYFIGDDPVTGEALFISKDTVYRTSPCAE